MAALHQNGPGYLISIIPTPFNPTVWKVILSYMAVELALMRWVGRLGGADRVPVQKALDTLMEGRAQSCVAVGGGVCAG